MVMVVVVVVVVVVMVMVMVVIEITTAMKSIRNRTTLPALNSSSNPSLLLLLLPRRGDGKMMLRASKSKLFKSNARTLLRECETPARAARD